MEFGENGAVISSENTVEARSKLSEHAYPDGTRSAMGLFKWMAIALYANMAAEFLLGSSSALLLWLYLPSTDVPFSYQQLQSIDYIIVTSGIFHLLTYITCIFLVSRFTYRTMRNLHTIGNKQAIMSPGWAVGWYFIPFANLFKPAQGMSQIYHGTHQAVGESSTLHSPIPLWWTFWLLANFAANIGLRVSGGMTENNPTTISFSFDIASAVFAIIAAWALIRLSRRIAERQEMIKHGDIGDVFD